MIKGKLKKNYYYFIIIVQDDYDQILNTNFII